tara:strand:+ start:265 stop:429 length:165 start_codon:yes stop_codon:yes gene_type:complete
MCAPDAYGDESLIGIVLETDVNMWGEEVIPTGVRVLWPEDITVETEDELEVYSA